MKLKIALLAAVVIALTSLSSAYDPFEGNPYHEQSEKDRKMRSFRLCVSLCAKSRDAGHLKCRNDHWYDQKPEQCIDRVDRKYNDCYSKCQWEYEHLSETPEWTDDSVLLADWDTEINCKSDCRDLKYKCFDMCRETTTAGTPERAKCRYRCETEAHSCKRSCN